MRKVLAFLVILVSLDALGQVALKTEGQDPQYVETIKGRAQKIVDGLQLTDKKQARNDVYRAPLAGHLAGSCRISHECRSAGSSDWQ